MVEIDFVLLWFEIDLLDVFGFSFLWFYFLVLLSFIWYCFLSTEHSYPAGWLLFSQSFRWFVSIEFSVFFSRQLFPILNLFPFGRLGWYFFVCSLLSFLFDLKFFDLAETLRCVTTYSLRPWIEICTHWNGWWNEKIIQWLVLEIMFEINYETLSVHISSGAVVLHFMLTSFLLLLIIDMAGLIVAVVACIISNMHFNFSSISIVILTRIRTIFMANILDWFAPFLITIGFPFRIFVSRLHVFGCCVCFISYFYG